MQFRIYRDEDGTIAGVVEEHSRSDITPLDSYVVLRDAKGAAIEVKEFQGDALAYRDWRDPSDSWVFVGEEA